MTASNQQSNVGQNFLDRALGALFSFGSGREGSPQRQAYDDIVKAQQEGKIPAGANLDVLYNRRLDQIVKEGGGTSVDSVLEAIQPGSTKTDAPEVAQKPDESTALKPDEKPQFVDPERPDRYTGDAQAGQDATTTPPRMSDFYQTNLDLIKEQFDRLPGLIDQQNKAELERIAATSAAAKEREVVAQWAATERAMIQRDAAMALGLMNTAYLANTPNVSLMQQLNAPLAAVASNYKLPLPGGNK